MPEPIRRQWLIAARRAARVTQEQLAQGIGVDTMTVSRWERGVTGTIDLRHQEPLAEALKVSIDELDRKEAVYQASSRSGGRSRAAARATPALVRDQESDLQRRAFLNGAGAVAPVAVAPLERLGHGLPGAAELDRLRAATWRATRFERSSQYSALAAVLPGLISTVEHLAVQAAGSRPDAARLLSQVWALRAWLLIKQDRPDDAEASATGALDAASRADDTICVGAALRCLGEVHMRAGRLELARDLAVEAAECIARGRTTSSDALAVQGAGYLSAAMACARHGDRHGADELIDAADTCASQLGHEVAGAAVFGPSNVEIHRVAAAVELDDHNDALRRGTRHTARPLAGCEERYGRYLIDLARAYAGQQHDDQALHTLLDAEQAAPEEVRTHRLTRSVLTELLGRERRSRTPGLRPLAQRCAVELA